MKKLLVSACLATFALAPSTAQAQLALGGQLSYAEDADIGIGARGAFGVPLKSVGGSLEIIGSLDYYFPGDVAGFDVTYWELNGNVAYLFNIPSSIVVPYAGAGLNFAYASVDVGLPSGSVSDTQLGLNLLGGARFNLGPVTPFGELKFEVNGGEQFVISGGAMYSLPGF